MHVENHGICAFFSNYQLPGRFIWLISFVLVVRRIIYWMCWLKIQMKFEFDFISLDNCKWSSDLMAYLADNSSFIQWFGLSRK